MSRLGAVSAPWAQSIHRVSLGKTQTTGRRGNFQGTKFPEDYGNQTHKHLQNFFFWMKCNLAELEKFRIRAPVFLPQDDIGQTCSPLRDSVFPGYKME